MGSSANRTAGPGDEGAGHGDALLLAAGELGRTVRQAVLQADGLDDGAPPGLVRPAAGQRERQDDVLVGRQRGQQVEALEDEADLVAAQLREPLLLEARDLGPVDPDLAAAGLVEAGEDVHEGALAGAGRPHDGREPALRDVDVDAAQGAHGGVALAVGACEVARLDDGAARGRPAERRSAAELTLQPVEGLACGGALAIGDGDGTHCLSSCVTRLVGGGYDRASAGESPGGGEWAGSRGRDIAARPACPPEVLAATSGGRARRRRGYPLRRPARAAPLRQSRRTSAAVPRTG